MRYKNAETLLLIEIGFLRLRLRLGGGQGKHQPSQDKLVAVAPFRERLQPAVDVYGDSEQLQQQQTRLIRQERSRLILGFYCLPVGLSAFVGLDCRFTVLSHP